MLYVKVRTCARCGLRGARPERRGRKALDTGKGKGLPTCTHCRPCRPATSQATVKPCACVEPSLRSLRRGPESTETAARTRPAPPPATLRRTSHHHSRGRAPPYHPRHRRAAHIADAEVTYWSDCSWPRGALVAAHSAAFASIKRVRGYGSLKGTNASTCLLP